MKTILTKIAKRNSDERPQPFLVVGLPRSGTTYLMTLLNSHPQVFCTGEQFNPYGVVGIDDKDERHETFLARDKSPVGFLDGFFADAAAEHGGSWVGCKYMIGHNVQILRALEERPDITLIYVWRENKLAQAASWIKALRSKKWAQVVQDEHVEQVISASPRDISHRWHELATQDYLFRLWFDAQPHQKKIVEYKEMFQPEFEDQICTFLGIGQAGTMKSPLIKQGANKIPDRFSDPKPILYYFQQLGLEHWLEDEI